MNYLPIFIDVRGRSCLVVGGGAVALRKVELLLRAGAEVRVVAPKLCTALAALAESGAVGVVHRGYAASDLDGMHVVVAATDDLEVNARVAADAKTRALPVNVVDSPGLCSFIMPSIVDRAPVLVAISTGGVSPTLARLVAARIEAALPAGLGRIAAFAARHRAAVRQRIADPAARRQLWEQVLEGEAGELAMLERDDEADRSLAVALDDVRSAGVAEVALIAAGDGDPDRLSLRAARALGRADLLLHEHEVSSAVLALARREAERTDVGQLGSPGGWSFEDVISVVSECARKGRRACVVRVGDPYADEHPQDARSLREAGLRFAVMRPAPV